MQLTSRNIIISLGTWYFCYICYCLLKYYMCAMLGQYEFKQLVGKNKIGCLLSAQNNGNRKYCHFKHIILMRFNFNKSMVALKGKLELKAQNMLLCFQNHLSKIFTPFYFLNQIMFQKSFKKRWFCCCDYLFIVTPIVGVYNWSMFLLYVTLCPF